MSFLAMIVALVLLQVWGSASRVHHDSWLPRLQSYGQGLGMSPAISLFFTIAIPALVLNLVLGLLESLLFGLLWIGATALVLLYSFGRGDFQAILQRFRSYCHNENFESAYLDVQSELAYGPDEEGPATLRDLQLKIQRCVLYEGYQRWFAVLFYFVLLGPEAALVYRLLQLCRHDREGQLARRLMFYADWVPARLLAATFALAGDFIRGSEAFLASFKDTQGSASSLLLTTAEAALGAVGVAGAESPVSTSEGAQVGEGDRAASRLAELESLLSRSATVWLVIISVLVLL